MHALFEIHGMGFMAWASFSGCHLCSMNHALPCLCVDASRSLLQAVTGIEQQQQQTQFQVVSQQQQPAQAYLNQQQERQPLLNQQQPLQQQRRQRQRSSSQQPQQVVVLDASADLLQAIQTAAGYHQLAFIVSQSSSEFQPHHTAAALLRLANIVTGRTNTAAQQAAAAAALQSGDEYEGEQDWAGPQLASLDSAVDTPGTASRDETYSSISSGSGSAVGASMNGYNSSSSRFGYSSSSGRNTGLAGLIAIPGSEIADEGSGVDGTAQSRSSSIDAAAGFLSGATMAARMEKARQQQWEQQQLRLQAWGAGTPAQQQQQQQWLRAAGDPSGLAAQQWQAGDGFSAQQQQVIVYDVLLRKLLGLARRQALHMSGSSGLTVLTALVMMRQQPSEQLLQELLKHPLWCGLPKLRPAGLVSTVAKLAALKVQPRQQWLRRYVALLQKQQAALTGQQLALLVSSLGRLGWVQWPEGWGAELAGRCAPQLGSMTGQELLQVAQVGCCCCSAVQLYVSVSTCVCVCAAATGVACI